jgi:ADP-ribose pyrophosphatase YjhB (NUDIX family)
MPVVKRKAFAYVTHRNRLLIFTHPDSPEAGIQVPAGTLEDGEDPRDGALREATEETGLGGLEVVRFLGEQRRDLSDYGMDEINHRYFFHLACREEPPETWRHGEFTPSDGGVGPIPFDFFWARLPDEVPELIADHGYFLPALLAALGLDGDPGEGQRA